MIISLKNVSISYWSKKREYKIISNFNSIIKPNFVYSILGPNGCGKTSLFRALLEQINISNGVINFPFKKPDISYIPQSYKKALFPWLTVKENYDLYINKNTNQLTKNYKKNLKHLNIKIDNNQKCRSLSGGESQILLLVLNMLRKTSVYLLDEPFSAIDFKRRKVILQMLKEFIKNNNFFCLIILHDLLEISEISDYVIIFTGEKYEQIKVLSKKDFNNNNDFYEEIKNKIMD